MRAVVQRVMSATVTVGTAEVATIGTGFAILVGVGHGDRAEDGERLAAKIAALRVFEDPTGRMNLGLRDLPAAGVLAIPQFTLYADVRRGRRPDFGAAAAPSHGERLFAGFCGSLRGEGVDVREGRFGAQMRIALDCDGPVTIILTSDGWAEGDLGAK
ncbi:MAG: D-tyrosyl-tRNA(Tyr) deacylase [Chloroflexi bacterium]|nr:D-tyrosyl-tRNA(Tyr) deacylase [Chloroflexota bacterium]